MEEPLKIYTLGEFKVKYKGELLNPQERTNDKPWLLFKYLITERGKNIHPEIIINELWPDQEFKDPKHTITNLVYRLRKNLLVDGKNEAPFIINCRGRCTFNKDSNYWLDIEEFTDLCKRANIVNEEEPDKSILYYEKAFNMYKGDYLPEIPYHDWVIPSRNNYHWFFVESVIGYINELKKMERFEEIMKICERSFEIELLEEEIHLAYIEALLNKGKNGHAKHHYKYAKELLNNSLDVGHIPKLEELYKHDFKVDKTNYLNKIKDNLEEKENVNGAFSCSSDIFRMVYKLEKRKAERNNKPLFIAYVKFNSKSKLEKNIYYIESIIKKKLRKGDIITRWDSNQYLLLLSDINKQNIINVLERIYENLNEELEFQKEDIELDYQTV